MAILYVIPELAIVAIIFGTWKMAYDAKKKEVHKQYALSQDASGVIAVAVGFTIAGIGALIGIAVIWENFH